MSETLFTIPVNGWLILAIALGLFLGGLLRAAWRDWRNRE